MRGFHTAALFAVVALALCAGGAADTNTPQARGTGASNIGTADARLSLNITTAAERPQGSDADELTRGRRPIRKKPYSGKPHGNEYKPFKPHPPVNPSPSHSQHCDDVVEGCSDNSDCLRLFPCKYATCETNHETKKKKEKKKKKYKWGRSDEDDEKDHPEEYERQSNWGTCVCGEVNKDGPCLSPEDFPDDCTSIRTNVGICSHGICRPDPRDDGCPCPDGCSDTELSDDLQACLDTDQLCKCLEGICKPNYLPAGTSCDYIGLHLGSCEVGKCNVDGACTAESRPTGSGCYVGDTVACENAGKCEYTGECTPLTCICDPDTCSDDCPCEAGKTCESDVCVDCPGPCFKRDGTEFCCAADMCEDDGSVNAYCSCSSNDDCLDPSKRLCCNDVCVADIGDACPFMSGEICCVDQDAELNFLICTADADCPCTPFTATSQCPSDEKCCGNPLTCQTTCLPGQQPCGLTCSLENGATATAYCDVASGTDGCDTSCGSCIPSLPSAVPGCNNAESCEGGTSPSGNLNTFCKEVTGINNAKCDLCTKKSGEKGCPPV